MTSDGNGGDMPQAPSDMASAKPNTEFKAALEDPRVTNVARSIVNDGGDVLSLHDTLRLGLALAQACHDETTAVRLQGEMEGYGDHAEIVPDVRKATGFASPFPVRALDLGLLDPEEIFTANNEKFSQVKLTIGQPVAELEAALVQIQDGGVLALRVPASEVTHRSAQTSEDTEIYIYIMPKEIIRIVEAARSVALEYVMTKMVYAAAGL